MTAVVAVMDGMYQDVTCTTGTLRVSVPAKQQAPGLGKASIVTVKGKKYLRDSAGRLYLIVAQ